MKVNVRNTTTGETVHENLLVRDVLLGVDTGDNKLVLLLPEGEPIILPLDQHIVSGADE